MLANHPHPCKCRPLLQAHLHSELGYLQSGDIHPGVPQAHRNYRPKCQGLRGMGLDSLGRIHLALAAVGMHCYYVQRDC